MSRVSIRFTLSLLGMAALIAACGLPFPPPPRQMATQAVEPASPAAMPTAAPAVGIRDVAPTPEPAAVAPTATPVAEAAAVPTPEPAAAAPTATPVAEAAAVPTSEPAAAAPATDTTAPMPLLPPSGAASIMQPYRVTRGWMMLRMDDGEAFALPATCTWLTPSYVSIHGDHRAAQLQVRIEGQPTARATPKVYLNVSLGAQFIGQAVAEPAQLLPDGSGAIEWITLSNLRGGFAPQRALSGKWFCR